MALTNLTAHEARQLDDYLPSLSNRTPGMDLAAKLDAIINEINNIVTGTATVLDGNTTVVVAVGAEYNGKPVLVSFAEAPTAADLDVRGAVAAGNLTITITADNTADIDVNYLIDGR